MKNDLATPSQPPETAETAETAETYIYKLLKNNKLYIRLRTAHLFLLFPLFPLIWKIGHFVSDVSAFPPQNHFQHGR